MITNKTISKLALMIIAIAPLALTGCSVIGLGIGAIVDSSKPDQQAVPGWQVMTIMPGKAITIILTDGDSLTGQYSGLERIPAEQYAVIYSQAREQKPGGVFLPALGDSIWIGTSVRLFKEFDKKLECTLEGFEHDRILIRLKGTTALSDVPFSFVTKIVSGSEHVISGESIKRLILEGKIPVLSSAIVLESEAGKTRVSIDKVNCIITPVKKRAALEGFVTGALIDAFIVVIFVAFNRSLSFGLDMGG